MASGETPRRATEVHVTSPCSMQAGFSFLAEHNGKAIQVTVPPGGVEKGDIIAVPYPHREKPKPIISEVTPFLSRESFLSRADWKSPLFDCGRYGYCHPHVWSAILCPQLLLAQILTRQKMNWLGEKAPDHEWKSTFRKILSIVVVYWTLSFWLAPPSSIWMWDSNGRLLMLPNHKHVPALQIFVYNSLFWMFTLYTVVLLIKLRRTLRKMHNSSGSGEPAESVGGVGEDVALAVCCGCCVVAQMARETCDYDKQSAACCSPSGLGLQYSKSRTSTSRVVSQYESISPSSSASSISYINPSFSDSSNNTDHTTILIV